MNSKRTTESKKTDSYKPKDASRSQQRQYSSFGLSDEILELHQTIGNHAVGQMIQAKLRVNEPRDKYEQGADRVAEQVMRMSDTEASGI